MDERQAADSCSSVVVAPDETMEDVAGSGIVEVAGAPDAQEIHGGGPLGEVLTQATNGGDLTQLMCDSQSQMSGFLSPLPDSPHRQHPDRQPQPWARLMSCCPEHGNSIVQLLPKPRCSEDNNNNNNNNSSIFNEHTLGRSLKCDIPAVNPRPETARDNPKLHARQEWAYGMISNRHCKIYCCYEPHAAGAAAAATNEVVVYIEDCSGNGTTINQTTVLRQGEKRRLHSGDEIGLVNRHNLRKKIRSATELQKLLQPHSYVFVLLPQNMATNLDELSAAKPTLMAEVTGRTTRQQQFITFPNHSGSSSKKRKAAVNVRATQQSHWSPRTNAQSVAVFPLPQPRRHNYNNFSPLHDNRRSPASAALLLGNNNSNNALQFPKPHRRIQQDYDIRELIGQGTVGEVRRAIHRTTGVERAVKIIVPPRHLKNDPNAATFFVEAEILRRLRHPYVVKLIDVYTSETNSNNNNQQRQQQPAPMVYYLVMELLHGGDLFDRIVQKGHYREPEARRVLRRLLNALFYLHERHNIVHRDLKPENILLVSKHDDTHVQLTDFGLAKQGDDLKTFCGTPAYFAPEVLKRRHTVMGQGRYGKPADLWSLGVILYVLLTGMPPFEEGGGADPNPTVEFPNDMVISESAQDLVRQLLQQDPRRRLTVIQACEHPWILQCNDGEDTHAHPLDDPVWTERENPNAASSTPTSQHIREEASVSVAAGILNNGDEVKSCFDAEQQQQHLENATSIAMDKVLDDRNDIREIEDVTENRPMKQPVTAEMLPVDSIDIIDTSVPAIESLEAEHFTLDGAPSHEESPPPSSHKHTATEHPIRGVATPPIAASSHEELLQPSSSVAEFPPLPVVLGTTFPLEKSGRTSAQGVSAANYSFRREQIEHSQSPQTPRRSDPPRRPLSPLSGNDDSATQVLDRDKSSTPKKIRKTDEHGVKYKNNHRLSAGDGNSLTTSTVGVACTAITPATCNGPPTNPASNTSSQNGRQTDTLVACGPISRNDNRINNTSDGDRLDLSDDEIFSTMSENTDSISSFSTVAERDSAEVNYIESKTIGDGDSDKNKQVPTRSAAQRSSKKRTKSGAKKTAVSVKTGESKKRKTLTATANASPGGSTKNKDAGGKQTTLKNWFKKNGS